MCASATTMNKRKQDDHDDGCDHHRGDHDDDHVRAACGANNDNYVSQNSAGWK